MNLSMHAVALMMHVLELKRIQHCSSCLHIDLVRFISVLLIYSLRSKFLRHHISYVFQKLAKHVDPLLIVWIVPVYFSNQIRHVLDAAVNYACMFWINILQSKHAQYLFRFIYINLVDNSDALFIINIESKKVFVSSICLYKSTIGKIVQMLECIVSKLFEVYHIMS